MPFNFQDSICDRIPRLTYVGGFSQLYFSTLLLGGVCANGNTLNIKLKPHFYSERYLFTYFCTSLACTGGFVVKA